MNKIAYCLGLLTLGPLMLATGAIAAVALLSSWFSDLLALFGGGTGGWVDALFGGPGAPRGTFVHYMLFIVFGVTSALCSAGLAKLKDRAYPEPSGLPD